jgi:hypothetical protein
MHASVIFVSDDVVRTMGSSRGGLESWDLLRRTLAPIDNMPFFGDDIISVPPDTNKIFHPGHCCVFRIVRGGILSHGPADANPP